MDLIKNSVCVAVLSLILVPVKLWAQPFQPGEKVTYDIKKFNVSAGKAIVEYKGETTVDGVKFLEIIFTAKGPKFLDEEIIYLEPETFYPLKVERNLNIFGNEEKITEVYDPKSGKVKITKLAGGKTTEQVLEKEGRLDNIYGFLYRYRLNGNFKTGNTVKLNLPTKNLTLKIIKQYKISVGGKTYDSFFMQSDPKRYNIWFDPSSQRLPLRIDGALGMGKTSMQLEKVEFAPAQ